jgi:decaprenylphospho-beta-D-erythro-pentofuranosid-2-ulose 2-reductase
MDDRVSVSRLARGRLVGWQAAIAMSVSLSKVIVVGASSGIGAALTRALAARGARVAAVARRTAELEAVAGPFGDRVHPYAFDTTDVDAVPALFERLVADLGGLDTLIYCAGVMPSIAEGEYAFVKDRAMVDVNLLAPMAWMNLAAARFEAGRAGSIVGISSIAGERGRRKNPAYCATKAGLSAYLEALRNRCSRYGVNVVTAKPGFVDTDMTRGLPGLFWLISADEAARIIVKMTERGNSADGFVPPRWRPVATVVRAIPSVVFRRLNF